MKEATGELSTTAIAVVAIAAIAVIFTTLILPVLRNNIKARTYCSTASCPTTCTNGKYQCTYYDENMQEQNITCPCTVD